MNTTTHPDSTVLLGFIDTPNDKEYLQTSLHIATCSQCRSTVAQLATLTAQLKQNITHLSNNDIDDSQLQQIHAYVDNKLPTPQKESVTEQIHNNKAQLKAALHYAANQATPAKEAGPTTRIQLAKLIQWLQWRPPVWTSAIVTAMLVIVLTMALESNFSKPLVNTSSQIIAYQDNPIITFKKIQTQRPGIGFFNNIGSTTKPFANIGIQKLSKSSLRITWPSIENAVDYSIRLHNTQNGQRIMLKEHKTENNYANFDNIPLQSGVRYEWQLAGKTSQGSFFKTAGGFVLSD